MTSYTHISFVPYLPEVYLHFFKVFKEPGYITISTCTFTKPDSLLSNTRSNTNISSKKNQQGDLCTPSNTNNETALITSWKGASCEEELVGVICSGSLRSFDYITFRSWGDRDWHVTLILRHTS